MLQVIVGDTCLSDNTDKWCDSLESTGILLELVMDYRKVFYDYLRDTFHGDYADEICIQLVQCNFYEHRFW